MQEWQQKIISLLWKAEPATFNRQIQNQSWLYRDKKIDEDFLKNPVWKRMPTSLPSTFHYFLGKKKKQKNKTYNPPTKQLINNTKLKISTSMQGVELKSPESWFFILFPHQLKLCCWLLLDPGYSNSLSYPQLGWNRRNGESRER